MEEGSSLLLRMGERRVREREESNPRKNWKEFTGINGSETVDSGTKILYTLKSNWLRVKLLAAIFKNRG